MLKREFSEIHFRHQAQLKKISCNLESHITKKIRTQDGQIFSILCSKHTMSTIHTLSCTCGTCKKLQRDKKLQTQQKFKPQLEELQYNSRKLEREISKMHSRHQAQLKKISCNPESHITKQTRTQDGQIFSTLFQNIQCPQYIPCPAHVVPVKNSEETKKSKPNKNSNPN